MLTGEHSSELLNDIARKVAEMARATPPDTCPDVFGLRVAAMLADDWGGLSVYIPKSQSWRSRRRNKELYAAFTGDNITELARLYGLSEQHVYKLLKDERERRRVRQGVFPGLSLL